MNFPTNTDIKMDPLICSSFPECVASSKMDNSFNSDLQIKEEQKEEDEAHLVQESQVTFKCEINEEMKLEQEELIIKDEPEEVEELSSLEIIKYNTNPPTLGIRDRTADTEIKVDPAITRIEELLKICTCDIQVMRLPEQVFKSKMERYLNFNLQDNTGKQFEEEDCTAHQLPTYDFECKINEEIKLEQEELIIKDEPEEVEELSSLEIIKYNTDPPTLGIRDHTANTEIKVDPAITRIEELLKICTCDIQVMRLPEQLFKSKMERYLNFNLQDNTGQQFEEEDCTAHQLPTFDFECKVCSLCVPLSLFKQHMLSHKDAKHKHGKQGNKNPKVYKQICIREKLFKCSKCKKCFTADCIKKHMLIHANKKLFKCQHCDKKFNLKSGLKIHMLFHENNRRFNCQQCGKGFNQNFSLKTHMLFHENKRRFKCQQCDKGFNQNCDLKKHMLIHENKRSFKCQWCDKGFNRNSHLKAHMLTHENKRPFKCAQCDKGFNRNCDLKKHMLIHENKRPFNC